MSEFSDMLEDYATLAVYIDGEEAKLKGYKEARDNLKAAVLAQMSDIGIKNAKSVAGHAVCLVTNLSTKVEDADAFFTFVFDSPDGGDAFLTKHVNKDAVDKYMDEHEGACPPGIKVETINSLRFTKAK